MSDMSFQRTHQDTIEEVQKGNIVQTIIIQAYPWQALFHSWQLQFTKSNLIY